MTSLDTAPDNVAHAAVDFSGNGPAFLSTLTARPGERRIATAFLVASAAVFLAIVPFARMQLAPRPGFIAIYETALVITDLITAVFLFGQFAMLQSRALLLLASGYLFTACLAVAHALSFPGLFSPSGLLGAGPQTTAWLYMFWHAGFPVLVIAYARCDARAGKAEPSRDHDRPDAVTGVATVLAAACALTLIATVGHDALPAIMQGNHYTPAMTVVQLSILMLNFGALAVLWRRRPHSVLDLWLMVVMCAWVFDITLSAILNAGRYDLGFYAGRVYGLVASSFVLAMLILENSLLYVRLMRNRERERQQAAELAAVDALTGIANRRSFEETLDQEWRRARRHRTPLCLLMIDVDEFKRFNDAYGHVAGDQCLRAIARVLAGNARRAGQMAARYGGEEFAVLLPHVHIDEAHSLAQRICEEVRELDIPHKDSTIANLVTISVGVASALLVFGSEPGSLWLSRAGAPGGVRGPAPTALVEAADRALYDAQSRMPRADRRRSSRDHGADRGLNAAISFPSQIQGHRRRDRAASRDLALLTRNCAPVATQKKRLRFIVS
jgi:diguanylate cyclase (GGDEF)-like protein